MLLEGPGDPPHQPVRRVAAGRLGEPELLVAAAEGVATVADPVGPGHQHLAATAARHPRPRRSRRRAGARRARAGGGRRRPRRPRRGSHRPRSRTAHPPVRPCAVTLGRHGSLPVVEAASGASDQSRPPEHVRSPAPDPPARASRARRSGSPRTRPSGASAGAKASPSRAMPRAMRTSYAASTQTSTVTRSAVPAEPDPTPSSNDQRSGLDAVRLGPRGRRPSPSGGRCRPGVAPAVAAARRAGRPRGGGPPSPGRGRPCARSACRASGRRRPPRGSSCRSPTARRRRSAGRCRAWASRLSASASTASGVTSLR